MALPQLIINGTQYPFTSKDKYKAYRQSLSESFRMITGRLITEEQALIWVIEYSYDYFNDALRVQALDALCTNQELNVQFLSPETNLLMDGVFKCIAWPQMSVAFKKRKSGEDKAFWHNISFKLEEVYGR
jgi:hypothetical protein